MKTTLLACALLTFACSAEIGGAIVADPPDASVARVPMGDPEDCGNGLDDNGNGFIDEQCSCTAGATQACWPGDPTKRKIGACKDGLQTCNAEDSEFPRWGPCVGAVLPTTDSSDDGIDQDCDGQGAPPICVAVNEVCNDGKDNDCDRQIDCADPSCARNAACAPQCAPATESCTDGKDNDCDDKVDCADSNCASHPACAPPPACEPFPHWEVCGDGKDNECDGKTDCEDDECWSDDSCSCTETCTPGAVRWCDEAQYCHWGKQTCGPDRRWGACHEVSTHPSGCGSLLYDDDCCVEAGQCCQALDLLTPQPYSVGTCAPVTVTCTEN